MVVCSSFCLLLADPVGFPPYILTMALFAQTYGAASLPTKGPDVCSLLQHTHTRTEVVLFIGTTRTTKKLREETPNRPSRAVTASVRHIASE